MIKLWGRSSSQSVQKALWCLGETGVAFERLDGKPEDSPAYRRQNPTGLLPVLQDGGLIVWESNAIMRYVAARYGTGGLWPDDVAERSAADRWIDWQQGLVEALWPLFEQLVRKPRGEADPAIVERAHGRSAALLGQLDQWLDQQTFVAGDRFTIGDIPVGIWAERWFTLPVERPFHPNLEAWYRRLQARPAFQTHVMGA